MATNKKCYNCKHAGKGFKIGLQTHHVCLHQRHEEGLKSGKLHPFDTLMEFWQTCDDHELKDLIG